jgi:cytochrome c peroxidase
MNLRNPLFFTIILTAVIVGAVSLYNYDLSDASDLTRFTSIQTRTAAAVDQLAPLPFSLNLDQRKVNLGEQLFNESRLSGDGSVSCSFCHNLGAGGVDRLKFSLGIGGKVGTINAPTVFNSGFNFRQFWDGRAATLEDQIDGPLQNPSEMGGTWLRAIAMLSSDPGYRKAFTAIYSDGIQPNNVKDALATFERSLITPNSRFDQFLRGDKSALSEYEKAGYRLFKQIGCTSCHQGINMGGNMYQKLGIMEDYISERGNLTPADLGRFNLTKQARDRYFFKVPSLRNVALTPPYLHDGSINKLEDAVAIMVRFQLGKKLDGSEVAKITAFLRTLSGEYKGKPLE